MKARKKKKNFSRKMEGLLNAELMKRPTRTEDIYMGRKKGYE